MVTALTARGHTLATAESLTGGLVCAALTAIPGASAVVRGSVVAYATEIKSVVLGVDPQLLARMGAVDPAVAVAMATGVRRLLGATYGVATTGAAGPDAAAGGALTEPVPPGRGFVAVAGPSGESVRGFSVSPTTREVVRNAAVAAALELLLGSLE